MDALMLCVLLISNICNVLGKECLKNDGIGWRQGNIYECNDPNKPECCEMNRQFVCCEYNRYKNLREQIQLWGTVLFFCVALYVVYLYFTNDSVLNIPLSSLSPRGWCGSLKAKCCHRKKSMDFTHEAYIQRDLTPSEKRNNALA